MRIRHAELADSGFKPVTVGRAAKHHRSPFGHGQASHLLAAFRCPCGTHMRKRLPLRGGHLAADHFCRSPRLVDEHEVLWPLTSSGAVANKFSKLMKRNRDSAFHLLWHILL